MAELIIGHTTHDSALLWVRGDERYPLARVTLKPQPKRERAGQEVGATGERPEPPGPPILSDPLRLSPDHDHTGVASLVGELQPATHYRVVADFASSVPGLERPAAVQVGEFHTFPDPEDPDREDQGSRFSFLLGSCNLSTARLTSIGGLVAGALGATAASRAMSRPSSTWIWPESARDRDGPLWRRALERLLWAALKPSPRLSRWLIRKGTRLLLFVVAQLTRFEQPAPVLPSPFEPLLAYLDHEADERAAFVIHAGDQIYFDVDAVRRAAEVEEYRRAYRQSWFEDEATRAFLAGCPHYMILDDHEIIDGFANQPSLQRHLGPAAKAYREYVHARQPRQPGDALYYQFAYDQARFFVLDTRTERFPERGQMISPAQLKDLQRWLCANRHELLFVVSSVPFVAQLRPPEEDGDPRATKNERQDKWCGDAFREQRDRIIEFIHRNRIRRLVFLSGDMHCSYHATMRVGEPEARVAIHELTASPISQLQFNESKRFYPHCRGFTQGGVPFTSTMRSFHGQSPAVLHVTVAPESTPMLHWEVVRTSRQITENVYQPPPLRGRISFPVVGR